MDKSLRWMALAALSALMAWAATEPAAAGIIIKRSYFSSLAAGNNHTCVLHNLVGSQQVLCWGANLAGQAGTTGGDPNNENSVYAPVVVSGLASTVVQLTAGGDFTCALLSTGRAQCWGWGFEGQLGASGTGSSATPLDVGLAGMTQISAGDDHACALVGSNQDNVMPGVWCWGSNGYGQIDSAQPYTYPIGLTLVPLPMTPISVSAGRHFTCALLQDSIPAPHTPPYCWGENDIYAQLGDGATDSPTGPTPVSLLSLLYTGITLSPAMLGDCAQLTSGAELCWGDNSVGETGNGTYDPSLPPHPVTTPTLLSGATATVMASGVERIANCSVMTYHGTNGLYCWGAVPYFQGNNINGLDSPTLLPALTTGTPTDSVSLPSQIVMGAGHVCAIAEVNNVASHVFCWGNNYYGQVGNGQGGPSGQALAPPVEIL